MTEYPAETLAKEKETVTAVETGIADIGWVSISNIRGRFPLAEVTGLPFMGISGGKDEKGNALSIGKANSLVAWELYQNLPEMQKEFSSVKVLFTHNTELVNIVTTKKPVRNLEDLRGMKLRSTAGLLTELVQQLGATPVPIPLGEVYEAAQKGVLDGAAANTGQIINSRLYELLRYKTDINLGITTMFAMIMNLDKWNSLPPDVQEGLNSVTGRAGAEFAGEAGYGFGLRQALEDAMKKGGYKWETVSASPEEAERWKAIAGKPMWDRWLKEMQSKGLAGQKAFDELLRLQKKYQG